MKVILTSHPSENARGFSVIELLIVVSIISVVSGFAVMQITRARQVMIRENAALQFAGYLEKARVDSLRRHPMAAAQMAQVTIGDATSYSVTIDADGSGPYRAIRASRQSIEHGRQECEEIEIMCKSSPVRTTMRGI